MTKIIDLHQVDAFTDKLFGGNPAGVVTNADGLTEQQMLNIAREMNLSETAFVLPATSKADLKLRFFTPTSEVDFCGHATVATLYQLAQLKMFGLGDGDKNVAVETNIGIIKIAVTGAVDGQTQITFTAPPIKMESYQLQGAAFADKFGISADPLLKNGQVLIDRSLNYVYIPIESLDQLGELKFDTARICDQFAAENIIVFGLYAAGGFNPATDLHARGLAPLVGIAEDPFTGSMQAGLVQAAKQNAFIKDTKSKIIVEQGNFIGRPGFAQINLGDQTSVTATAVHVFSTKMEI